MLAFQQNNDWIEWTGQNRPRAGAGSFQLPRNVETAFSDAELADYGLHRVTLAVIPDGKRMVSYTLTTLNGKPVQTPVLEDVLPSIPDVYAERDRRLAAGFSYDFGDARGVHEIGTSAQDMVGWQEVTTAANAILATGAAVPLTIETNSGTATVTATEWQHILLAAAAFRQPIWQASFALSAMSPIPADYATNEAYWP